MTYIDWLMHNKISYNMPQTALRYLPILEKIWYSGGYMYSFFGRTIHVHVSNFIVIGFKNNNCMFFIPGDIRVCKRTKKGTEYRGTVSTTRNGYTCQDWTTNSPHKRKHNASVGSANYCRNPASEPEPWCYTTDPAQRWDNCDIPWCQGNEQRVKFCDHSTRKIPLKGVIFKGGNMFSLRKG
jgi:hypothetical protein